MNLMNAMNTTGTTENGAVTNLSSMNNCLDLFFIAGASRGKDISVSFAKAFAEDEELALRIALYMRDIRGGMGEREQFKNFIKELLDAGEFSYAERLMLRIPELGRFDDLKVFWNTPLEEAAAVFWLTNINSGNGLAAKWSPRQDRKGAKPLRKAAKMSEQEWRKFIVRCTDVVEQKMCANKWDEINYNHVPSVAAARYQKAFFKHDEEGYSSYRESLVKGEAKINASAVYPHDIISASRKGDKVVATEQWKALPNYLDGVEERILPMVDTSASMTWFNITPSCDGLDAALGLGLYVAERNESFFKNQVLTFHSTPSMYEVKGNTLQDKIRFMHNQGVGGSTNIAKAFDTVLKAAVNNKLSQDQLPTKIVIFSDMEFDRATESHTNFQYIKQRFEEFGYEMPQLVFWNLDARNSNFPVTKTDKGVALVSGFNTSIIKAFLGGDLDPMSVMLKAIMQPRYNF